MIILDTDHVTLVQRVDSPEGLRIRARILQLPSVETAATTIITYEEQIRGWFSKMSRARDLDAQIAVYERLHKFVADYRTIRFLPFDRKAATEYSQLRALRHRQGANDLKIAAIALAHNALLLTRNHGDFAGIPGLRVEDWTRP